jgi:hypothetical protein
MNKIRVGMLLDNSWFETQEEEARAILRSLRGYLGEDSIKSWVVSRGFSTLLKAEVPYDLLVVDYGGASIQGAWDLAEWEIRSCLEWGREHPSSLVLIWTDYTERVYRDALEEAFGHPDNLFFRYTEGKEAYDAFASKLRVWFGGTP